MLTAQRARSGLVGWVDFDSGVLLQGAILTNELRAQVGPTSLVWTAAAHRRSASRPAQRGEVGVRILQPKHVLMGVPLRAASIAEGGCP